MKRLLILCLIALAGLFWTIGLGLAFRTDGGLLLLALAGAAFAVRFGESLVQGRFRDEFRRAVPNSWLRRYMALFSYCIFAFPGIMAVCGQWATADPRSYGYVPGPVNPWSVAVLVALVLPAVMLVVWSQTTAPPAPRADPKA